MKFLVVSITIISAFLAIAYWGEAASYGWIVATAGWVTKCFGDEA